MKYKANIWMMGHDSSMVVLKYDDIIEHHMPDDELGTPGFLTLFMNNNKVVYLSLNETIKAEIWEVTND